MEKKQIFVLGFSLFAICAVSAAVMAFGKVATQDAIERSQRERLFESFRLLIPEFDNQIEKDFVESDGIKYYCAKLKGKVAGYIAQADVESGYSGKIEGILGISPDGKITGFIITSHSETPGLGGNVCSRTVKQTLAGLFRKKEKTDSKLQPNPVLDSFIGHSANSGDTWKQPWKITKDGGNVQHIAGATISSRAVAELAWKAADGFKKIRKDAE